MGSKIQDKAAEIERDYKESNIYISEFDTELEPTFSGTFRVNGTLYSFNNESATGWGLIPSDTVTYVRAVPSGNTCTLEYTNSAPTYDSAKLGWYGTGVGNENKRYITDQSEIGYLKLGKYDATTYVYKHIFGSGRLDRRLTIAKDDTIDFFETQDEVYKLNLAYGDNVITEAKNFKYDVSVGRIVINDFQDQPLSNYYQASHITGDTASIGGTLVNYSKGSSSVALSGANSTIQSGELVFRVER